MNTSLDDFVMSVRNGQEGPNIPSIRRNMRGDQVFELPFKTVCNGYCNKNSVFPLSLYTMMQQGICDDMSRRSEKSSLFRNLLDNVKNEWGYEDLYLPDVFVISNVDFDENNIQNEDDYLNTLLANYETLNSTISDNDDDINYNSLEGLRSDADDCLERNSNHMISLSADKKSPYNDLWADMSTLMKSDYLKSLQDSSEDSNVLRYATKKINKEIPDETPQMFTNLNLLEIMKLKQIEQYKQIINSNIMRLQDFKNQLDNILTLMPKPTNPSSSSWLSYFMDDGDISDNDSDDNSDDEISDTQKALDSAITGFYDQESYQPEHNDDNDLDVDDVDVDDVDVDDVDVDDEDDVSKDNTEEFVLTLDNSSGKNFNFF